MATEQGNFRNLRAFTLFELVMVLMVIVICAMIAAPKLADFARGRVLPNAAMSLSTTARWCQMMAKTDGTPYRLNLDPSSGRYWVTKDDGTGVTFKQVTDENGAATSLPQGITMSSENLPNYDDGTYITFWPGGQTDVAVIALSNDRRTLNVACETPLGAYRVYDSVTGGLAR